MKAVHVELTDEGGIVVVFEQLRDKGFGEFIFVKDDERVAIIRPTDQVGVSAVFKKAA